MLPEKRSLIGCSAYNENRRNATNIRCRSCQSSIRISNMRQNADMTARLRQVNLARPLALLRRRGSICPLTYQTLNCTRRLQNYIISSQLGWQGGSNIYQILLARKRNNEHILTSAHSESTHTFRQSIPSAFLPFS